MAGKFYGMVGKRNGAVEVLNGAVELSNGAVEVLNGAVELSNGAVEEFYCTFLTRRFFVKPESGMLRSGIVLVQRKGFRRKIHCLLTFRN